jgi:CRISPR-associated protein Csx17
VTLVTERLAGCTAESLDSYLRGLGFFLLAGEVEPSVRAWWDEDGTLCLASTPTLARLVERVVHKVCQTPPLLRTPWRGGSAHGRDFVELRNLAEEGELDWFDASTLVLSDGSRRNNPLLGEGASFGKGEIADGYGIALSKLQKAPRASAEQALLDLILGQPGNLDVAKALTVDRKILSAYQSGRAAVPGSSSSDLKPTSQKARTPVWDVVLVLRGLRLFRGTPARRADSGALVQGAFPLVVQSRPLGTGPADVADQRRDPPRTFEVLAPVWTHPCSARALAHLVPVARLRLRGGVARDTLDAALIQSARAAGGLGFDRLVRFALIPPDPKKPARYATRRGEMYALGQAAARRAADEILPFLRDLERALREEPPSLAIVRRRLEDALATFGRKRADPRQQSLAVRVQDALIALALLQTPAARAAPDLLAPRLSSAWFGLADDGAAEFRLARSLVAGFTDAQACLLRETLLPQRRIESGRFVLDATRTPPDLERVADPLAVLVTLVLAALRRTEQDGLTRAGSTPLDALAALLSGALGREGERRLALLAAALAGIHPSRPLPAREQDPAVLGLGADVARLLLAAQSAAGEDCADSRAPERAAALASLLLAGRTQAARIAADRELRRRGLELLPTPSARAPSPRPALLAVAVLLPLDEDTRDALERLVALTPTATREGGAP